MQIKMCSTRARTDRSIYVAVVLQGSLQMYFSFITIKMHTHRQNISTTMLFYVPKFNDVRNYVSTIYCHFYVRPDGVMVASKMEVMGSSPS